SPALCRLLLKPTQGRKNILFRGFERVFGWVTAGYTVGVRAAIRHSVVTLIIFGVLCYAAYRFSSIVPGGFLPEEGQGYVMAVVLLPDGSSLDKTQRVIAEAEEFFTQQPAVANVVSLAGYDVLGGGTASTNSGVLFVSLKPFDERAGDELSAQQLIGAAW